MSQLAALKKVGKPLLRIGLPIVILALFLYQVKNNWTQLTAHTFQWNPWLLALAFLGFVVQELSFGLIWQRVLARLGVQLDLRACLRIYLASEFVRYIPGNVWHVLARILWIGKYGVSRPIAFASMTIELTTKLAAAALVFAISLLFWHDLGAVGSLLQGTLVVGVGVGTILALLVVLYPPVLNGLLNTALRLLKRTPVLLTVRYRDILLVTLFWCLSWCVAGGAFYALILALTPGMPLAALPICVGIYALAWDVGFLTFITPSGLGFRESAVVGLLALSLAVPTSLGGIIALLARFVSTMAEFLCVGLAYLSGGRQIRAIQQEQLAQPHSFANATESSVSDASSSEERTSVSVEGGTVSE